MLTRSTDDPTSWAFYEGLVKTTASRYHEIVQEEFEDCCQVLRLKVVQALRSYDPEKATQDINRYVFSCVRNQVKDLLKRQRRDDLYIEDIAPVGSDHDGDMPRDGFMAEYMREEEEAAFAEILVETPLIPSTLTWTEKHVLVFLYLGIHQADMAERLDVSRREVARAVRSIKLKMADWAPSQNGDAPLKGGPDGPEERLSGG